MSTSALTPRTVLVDAAWRPATGSFASIGQAIIQMVAGVAVVALLARVDIPMWPVPITGQTLGVLLVGATLGARRGGGALFVYMLAGLAGLPVFAGGGAGPAAFFSPSFGYIVGFIPAAALIGYLCERHWDRHPIRSVAGFGLASLIPFLIGVPWLGAVLASLGQPHDLPTLMALGVTPFLVGGVVKWAIAAATLPAAWRLLGRPTRSPGKTLDR
ncbi:MAG: biotin transporter BioY [Bowdeniella nasicola]|nr:biotin transporter BioY [Bowdeniella nasicola]